MIKEITGGVCAAQGFKASGIHCGVKEGSSPSKNDLALILSDKERSEERRVGKECRRRCRCRGGAGG